MFLIILTITITISLIFPQLGSYLYNLGYVTPFFIIIMYLSLGLSSNFDSLKIASKKIKTTLIIQSTIFIIAPVISFGLYLIFKHFVDSSSIIGILFIGAVPTTMTTCIIFTKQYEGDDILALCNALLSQILGVIVTPLLLYVFLNSRFAQVSSFSSVTKKLLLEVMIPFVVGQLLSKKINSSKINKIAKKITFLGIFPLIYLSVSQVVVLGDFLNVLKNGTYPILICLVFGLILILSTQLISKFFKFSKEERIAILFTGSQKTMGLGIPLVLMYFPNNPKISTNIIMMFLVYYIFSLIIIPNVAHHLQKVL